MITRNTASGTYYRKTGKGPAVVLLHGFPEDGNAWQAVWPYLSTEFTIIIPDLAGSGKTPLKPSEPSMEDFAGSINEILLEEQISSAVLAGHSMGGYVSLAFAELYNSKLAGLSLVHSTAAADSDEKRALRRKSIELIRKGGKEAFVKQMVPNLFPACFRLERPEVVSNQTEKGLQLSAESMIAFYNAMINRPDRTSTLELTGFPVQWIMGKEDSAIPPEAVLPQTRLAAVNYVSLYGNTGHMSMLEQTGKLNNDLKQFIHYCYYQ